MFDLVHVPKIQPDLPIHLFSISWETPLLLHTHPTPPLQGLEAFPPPGLVVYQQHWKQRRSRVIPSCCCTSADSEREAGTTRLAPSTSSLQTCHPSQLPLLCPCHCLVLGRLGKNAGALQQEDTMGSWAEAISKRPAAPHSLGIPESTASGVHPGTTTTGSAHLCKCCKATITARGANADRFSILASQLANTFPLRLVLPLAGRAPGPSSSRWV